MEDHCLWMVDQYRTLDQPTLYNNNNLHILRLFMEDHCLWMVDQYRTL
jgi:hypothetical protein